MLIRRSIYELTLPHRAVAVYMYLCDRAGKDGECFPSHKTIAADLHMSDSTVKRALSDLETTGCLEKTPRRHEQGGRKSNLYKV